MSSTQSIRGRSRATTERELQAGSVLGRRRPLPASSTASVHFADSVDSEFSTSVSSWPNAENERAPEGPILSQVADGGALGLSRTGTEPVPADKLTETDEESSSSSNSTQIKQVVKRSSESRRELLLKLNFLPDARFTDSLRVPRGRSDAVKGQRRDAQAEAKDFAGPVTPSSPPKQDQALPKTELVINSILPRGTVPRDTSQTASSSSKKPVQFGYNGPSSLTQCHSVKHPRGEWVVKEFRFANGRNFASALQEARLHLKELEILNQIKQIEILNQLDPHPNIEELINWEIKDHCIRIWVPKFPNTMLELIEDRIKRGESFTHEQIAAIMIQILTGLQFLHENQIVHRNVNVETLYCDFENGLLTRVVLCGFCFAQFAPLGRRRTKAFKSDTDAPEIHHRDRYEYSTPYDSQADIWDVGHVLYHLMYLQEPYKGVEKRKVPDHVCKGKLVESPPLQLDKIYTPLVELCKKMCSVKPKKRPTAQEALETLKLFRVSL